MFRKLALMTLVLLLAASALLVSAAPAAAQSTVTVVVQRGDTLSKIAARYCTSWRTIYDLNRHTIGSNPSRIYAGMRLTVPNHCPPGPGDPGNTGGVWDRGARRHAMGSFSAPWYIVARGDTLTSIGMRFGVTVQALRSANGLRGSTIFTGQQLLIPGSGGSFPDPWPQPEPVPGDVERVSFAPGAISAARSGWIQDGVARSYALRALAGQTMEIYTESGEAPLTVAVSTASGTALGTWGVNKTGKNSVFASLPETTDYIVTLIPIEGSSFNFVVTFVIR